MSLSTCALQVEVTLPLVCMCSLFSFLCGVGIGANDLSANFAMVVGSGSLNMKQAIIYCTVFELLGAVFMGGRVSSTIRNGIVDPALFKSNRDVVIIGMTSASFAAAFWLYLSTVFGLPVSITHTVVGSLLGFAFFSTWGFAYVKTSGLMVIVLSWVAAPLVACVVTAGIFYLMSRNVFEVKGRSFELALRVLPYCLAASLLVDFMFILIEQPPIMTQTLAAYVPLSFEYLFLLLLILGFSMVCSRWHFPKVAETARAATEFVWESRALRTELAELVPEQVEKQELLGHNLFLSKSSKHRPQLLRPSPETMEWKPSAVDHSLLKKDGCDNNPNQDDPLNGHAQGAGDSPGRSGLPSLSHTSLYPINNSSFVLSSLTPTDCSIVKTHSVRLAPTATHHTGSVLWPRGLNDDGGLAQGASGTCTLNYLSSSVNQHQSPTGEEQLALLQGNAALPHSPPTHHQQRSHDYGTATEEEARSSLSNALKNKSLVPPLSTPLSVCSDDVFCSEEWQMNHPMEPIRFGGILIKPFNPRAEYLFTGLQVVAGSMSSFVHGAVAGANATAAFEILYEAFTNHELGESNLSSQWSVLPAMLGIAIGMFALGASLMKTVGMELVTVTPARGWCIQVGSTAVTMILTGLGIPVSLSQSQVGAAIGCGVLDAKLEGVSWVLVSKIVCGWVVTLVISAVTTGMGMWFLFLVLC